MRLRIISCEVLFREISLLAARSPNQVDVEFLPNLPAELPAARLLQ